MKYNYSVGDIANDTVLLNAGNMKNLLTAKLGKRIKGRIGFDDFSNTVTITDGSSVNFNIKLPSGSAKIGKDGEVCKIYKGKSNTVTSEMSVVKPITDSDSFLCEMKGDLIVDTDDLQSATDRVTENIELARRKYHYKALFAGATALTTTITAGDATSFANFVMKVADLGKFDRVSIAKNISTLRGAKLKAPKVKGMAIYVGADGWQLAKESSVVQIVKTDPKAFTNGFGDTLPMHGATIVDMSDVFAADEVLVMKSGAFIIGQREDQTQVWTDSFSSQVAYGTSAGAGTDYLSATDVVMTKEDNVQGRAVVGNLIHPELKKYIGKQTIA